MQDFRSTDPKRAQDELLLLLAHELRNPVHALTTALDVFDASPEGSATAREAREVLRRQGARLTGLLDDLLAVARVLTGRSPLHRAPCDLATLVGTLVASRPRASWHPGSAGSATVTGDARWLQHALAALLDKALQQSPEGVQLQLAAAGGEAVLAIGDVSPRRTGPAAEQPPELQALVAQHLIELHGGTVQRHGTADGVAWRVVLPLVPAHGASLPRVTPRPAAVPE